MELRLQLQGVQLKDKWDFLQAAKGTMHGIMNTASASMSMYTYFALLKPQGKMILLGLPEKPLQISAFSLVTGKSVSEFWYSLCRDHFKSSTKLHTVVNGAMLL
jgi:D-arabinose 1-dehydrogenase-like Zn-dependent alcohol dehydrogenase